MYPTDFVQPVMLHEKLTVAKIDQCQPVFQLSNGLQRFVPHNAKVNLKRGSVTKRVTVCVFDRSDDPAKICYYVDRSLRNFQVGDELEIVELPR